ncbi:MAG: terminase gpA endonuclease subunit [Pseudomonadota bacterium]
MTQFAAALPIVHEAARAFRAAQRLSVAEGIKNSLVIRQPGGFSGPWDARETPYMVEPVNSLASRVHDAVCFVGPARTGKSMAIIDGWAAYNITCDPGDMLIVQMSQDKAREFSKVRIDREIRYSPLLAELMSPRGHDDNTHDKLFRHGMWLKIGWPSATQLSSSDYRYVAMTDYDRWPQNIEGEGPGFPMGRKRTQTFLSRGMAAVESSPRFDVEDPQWRPSTPHEAPPVEGILGIYNTSDRRRWYWRCPDCKNYFEAAPGMSLFATLPSEKELLEIVRSADLAKMADDYSEVVCPHCSVPIHRRHKAELNRLETARWVADGQTVTSDGEVLGDRPAARIAGYWMGGVAAAYQSWDGLVLRYLEGLRDYALTGSELLLKSTTNLDQGTAYTPQHLKADKDAQAEDRAEELERYHVPDKARFVIATVDVQGGTDGRFVVEVRAFGEHLESWLVDRYMIRHTERNGETAQVDPGGFPEDWDLLTEKVVNSTYKTSLGSELRVYRVGVDTGGEEGVTANAVAWYRRLRKQQLSSRVLLLKGSSRRNPERPMVKGHARTNAGKPMRDLPLWQPDTNYYKDIIAASLRRTVPGPSYFHPANWLPLSYYEELRAEVRQPNGTWKKVRKRNEALDLWVYALAVCESLGYGAKGKKSWDAPPQWAAPLADNSELISSEQRRAEQKAKKPAKRRSSVARSDWSSRL